MTSMTNNARRLVVLGADSDSEMIQIERRLRAAGEIVAYATIQGSRVHPGNAYRATGWTFFPWSPIVGEAFFDDGGQIVFVECFVAGSGPAFERPTIIDHHRPGDPGYGRPPEEYWEASSLGQVCALLGVQPIKRELLIAAADHCLEAAYRGRCPGVDPDELMRWRAESRAAFQKRPVEDVLADVEAARKRLRDAPTLPRHRHGYPIPWVARCQVRRRVYAAVHGGEHDPEGSIVFDGPPVEYTGGLGAFDEGDCHPSRWWEIDGADPRPHHFLRDLRGQHVPELPEAAAREGIPFLATVQDKDGRVKTVLQAAPPELVRRFMAGELVTGLKEVYGDPARGFAGGY